jgi:hypothetical protein
LSLYDAIKDLPLVVDGYDLDGHSMAISSDFTRKTTVFRLQGKGEEGLGEDVTYDAGEHDAQLERGPVLPLEGSWTIASFSQHLETVPIFAQPPERDVYISYRRWGFESAALDLALRQGDLSLADAVERDVRALSFVSSTRLGKPSTTKGLRQWLELYPWLRFKLDATSDWTDDLIEELRELGCVDSIDFKGQYRGTPVDQGPDVELYRRVIDGFPNAWLEDPALDDDTRAVLEPHADRITWDAIIHSVDDIASLPWRPRTVNVKPSRFGSLEALFAAYEYCNESGIGAYGGGQFELGPGRGQIQYLAALFHPDTPNDVAPGGFNSPDPVPGLPASPLHIEPRATGFLAL